MFEHLVSGSTLTGTSGRSQIRLTNMFWTNSVFFASGLAAGGLRYESDDATFSQPVYVANIETQYLAYGMHFIGEIFFGILENIKFGDANSTFSGIFDLMMERDYFGWDNASGLASTAAPIHADSPKIFHCRNIRCDHVGYIQYGICVEGAYNHFYDVNYDGAKYLRPFVFRGRSFSNKVYGIRMQDLNFPPTGPESGQHRGQVVFDASGTFSGGFAAGGGTNGPYTASSGGTNHTCFNNNVYDSALGNYPVSIGFLGSGYRNFIEAGAFGDVVVRTDDIDAGIKNILVVREGLVRNVSGNTKVTTSGNRIRIIDERQGSDNRGFFQDSGGKAIYTIPHGLFDTPGFINVTAASAQARAQSGQSPDVSGDTSNINVRYAANTNSGNVFIYWDAGVYASV